ncbi:uncharacterized protein LOC118964888 isoform X2 [Oncorhynchus mykiss]|uniref:uncharacterized protein LOC118964888 isoform X2 n=2 Tax=Oncorhynchus mykiss TaxID=8022 RepID=UPI0018789186|nr:uncharacterized protein LOC118964888 isoform X2 [Oncorhynchus mykiss]
MEDCYPILISFMRNLTDEQWQVIYKGFKKPMTKEQLAKLCKTIVNSITQTTLQILLPALARILGVTGFYDNKYLAKEMCSCGGRALRPRSSTPSSKSSQTSLKAHLGMPEDSIISSAQEQLSKSDQMVAAGQLSEIDKVVGTMLENIEKISSEFGEELVYQESLRSSSSLSFSTAKSQKTEWEFALPGTPIPSELPESTAQPIVRCSVIDMSESTKPKTMVCDARTSMFAIADTIMKKVYPEAEGQVTSHPDLTDPIARLEELISQGRIGALSRDLSHQVNRIISDSNLTPLGLTVVAGKSASDTILSKLKRNDKVGKPTTYELVQLFVEESVKCLLLPSFVPYSTSMSLAQGAKVLARVSEDRISCSSSSSSVFSDSQSLYQSYGKPGHVLCGF